MNHDFSLQVEEFKESIAATINRSNMPPAILYYVMKDTFKDVERSYFQYLDRVAKEEAAAAAKTENEAQEELIPQEEVIEN